MFASLTVIGLFIALACLERSFLNCVLETDLPSPSESWSQSSTTTTHDLATPEAYPPDS